MSVLVLVGVVTMYSAAEHAGLPLWCPPYAYDETAPGWIALDDGYYRSGLVECGDVIRIELGDGTVLRLQALDAGHLDRYCVEGERGREDPARTCVPIVGDVPELHWPYPGAISAPARIVNESAVYRQRGGLR